MNGNETLRSVLFQSAASGKRLCIRFHRPLIAMLVIGLCLLPLAVQARRGRRAATTTVSQQPSSPRPATGVISSGRVKSRKIVKRARTAQGPVTGEPPKFTPEQIEEMRREEGERGQSSAEGKFPKFFFTGAPVIPADNPPMPAPQSAARKGNAPAGPDDFLIRNRHDLTLTETSELRDPVHEPSLADLGGTIFYTANRYAARSIDGGQTFTYVSPFSTFPKVNGREFCCDQVVNSAPAQNMIFWALQYGTQPNDAAGTLRIARAVGAEVADNSWKYYDFTPQDFGFPAGNFMDFPTLTVSTNFLYVTSNVASTAEGNAITGSVVMRIPLSELLAGGVIHPQEMHFTDVFSPRCTEGSTDTTYFAGLPNDSSIRIYKWTDAAGEAIFQNIAVNTFASLKRDGEALIGNTNINWAKKALTRILAAWRRQGKLGFVWPAKQCPTCTPARPFPYSIVLEVNESDYSSPVQTDIYSADRAWLYPSVAVNAAGDLGVVIANGGGNFFVNTAVFLVDGVTPNFVIPSLLAVSSDQQPNVSEWGDYLTVRPHKTDPNTFVAGVYRMVGSLVTPSYLRFGRRSNFSVCGYSLNPTTKNISEMGGADSFTVTTGASCNWTATSNAPWISITGGASGSGNGAVNYTIAANTSGQRTGTITVSWKDLDENTVTQTFTITQTGCTFSIAPTTQSFSVGGGQGMFTLTNAGCLWTAQSDSNWITVTSGTGGAGNATIMFVVSANTGSSLAARTGTITVGDKTFTITQDAPNLGVFALDKTSQFFPVGGGSGTVNVTGNGVWQAASNESWITTNSSGTGNGTASFTVVPNNSGAARTGVLVIAGIPFVVAQASGDTLLEANFDRGIPAGWTVKHNGTGGGSAATWTAANPGGRVMDAPFFSNFVIVDSDKAGPSNTQDEQLITPIFNANGLNQVILEFDSQFLYQGGEAVPSERGEVEVSTDGGVNWLAVGAPLQGADDGFPAPRTRTINLTDALSLGDKSKVQVRFRYYNFASDEWWWAIDNVRIRCDFSVSPTIQGFTETGGNGSVNVVNTGCSWTAQSNDSWIVISPGSSNGTGNGTVNFTVSPNTGANTRTGTMTVAGKTVYVRQAAAGVPLETDFTGGLPLDWTVTNGGAGGGPASTWTRGNPCGRAIGGIFNKDFAIMDAGNCPGGNSGQTPNETLTSPVINIGSAGQVLLEFSNQFRAGLNQAGVVEVKAGADWEPVLTLQGADDGYPVANLKTLDITSKVSGNPNNVQVRFRYSGSGSQNAPRNIKQRATDPKRPEDVEYWWAVDDLKFCKYLLVPGSANPSQNGGPGSVQILTGANCKWKVTSSSSWITFNGTTSGVGNGTINYNVSANNGGLPRLGSIIISGQSADGKPVLGQTFPVTQGGCPVVTVAPATLPAAVLNAGYNQTLTASGSGSQYTFTISSGALPPGLSLSSGGALTGAPTAPGIYSFTVRATTPANCSGTRTYTIGVSLPPTIGALAVTRAQGSTASGATIGNVGDPEQSSALNALGVSVNDAASTSINGITISGLSVNAAGVVSANVSASCNATNNSFTLKVTDASGLTASATLNVTVTPNTAPVLSYNNQSIAPGGAATINPATSPSDNGSLASIALQNQETFTGTVSVNPTTGVISVSNAQPSGTHTITLRATDNCGLTNDVSFTLAVAGGAPTLGNYADTVLKVGGNTTITPSAAPVNAVGLTAKASTNFKGTLAVNPTTGVVRITNAHVPGTYPVTVTAYSGDGGVTTKTFTLTVNNPSSCPAGFTLYQPAGSPFAVGTGPRAVAVGDFNGDGNQDVATANETTNNVSLALGNGSGGFSAATAVAVGTAPQSLAVGDFNGDGKADLAVANNGSNNLTILLGDGLGGFTAGSPVAVGTGPRSVIAGDFNGDGKQDLAVANGGANNLTILLGNGVGNFAASAGSPISVGTTPFAVTIGDFNTDGKQDLAVANSGSNNVTLLSGNGSGGFSAFAGSPVAVGTTPVSIVVGDFNGDGKQDLATANSGANNLTILLGNGVGGFASATGSPVSVGTNPRSVVIGDFNGDSFQDLATANFSSGNLTLLLGNGNAAFSAASISPLSAGTNPSVLAAAGFNSDGKQDLVVGNFGSNNATILLNNCAPTLTPVALTRQQRSSINLNFAAVTDAEQSDASSVFTLQVRVNGSTSATVNGVTVSGLFLGSAVGQFDGTYIASANATISTTCVATTANFTFTVTDNAGAVTTSPFTVTVTPNQPPTLSYSTQSATPGGTATINPSTGPSDQGTISSIVVQSAGTYTGTLSVNNVTGVVSLSNAQPAGTHSITIRATDDCGAFTDASFPLLVAASPPTLGNYANANVITSGNTVATSVGAPINATGLTASTTANFKGTLGVNPATGAVTVTNAYPAGTYTVTVKAANAGGTTSQTFTLTVANPNVCASGSAFVPNTGLSVNAGNSPNSMVLGDFNGDGKPDLAVANGVFTNNVTILLGAGNGRFNSAPGSPLTVGGGGFGSGIALSDFNGDGKQDLAVTTSNNRLTILLGDGNGGFSPAAGSPITVGSFPKFVIAGDFNNDGKRDLAVANQSSNNVTILLGDGLGGLAAAGSPITVGNQPNSLVAADFNVDGKQDLAVTNSGSNNLTILLGNGSGGFAAADGSPIATGSGPNSVVTGQFNSDGLLDIAVANSSTGNVTILLGNGGGGFTHALSSPVSFGSGVSSLVSGDFNVDGKLDLAAGVGLTFGSGVAVMLGNGNGGFSAEPSSPTSVGASISSIGVGDFNSDGKLDFAVAKSSNNGMTILLGTGGGAFIAATTNPPISVGKSPGSQLVGDFNNDGKQDIVVPNAFSNDLTILLGDGNGGFNQSAASPITGISNPRSMAMGDFNGDGKPDLAVGTNLRNIVILLGDGSGGFTAAAGSPLSLTEDPGSMVVSDFNGDGKQDLAVLKLINNNPVDEVVIFLGNGGGGFTAGSSTQVGNSPTALVLGDFNNDGKSDLAVTHYFSSDLWILLGTGLGGFFPATNSPIVLGGNLTGMAMGDFNDDGNQDLAVVKENSNAITIMLGNGLGGFTAAANSPTLDGSGNIALTTGDFNGDGKQDIAGIFFQSPGVTILLGVGNGTFTKPSDSFIPQDGFTGSIVTGDFNRDGRQDLALTFTSLPLTGNNQGYLTVLLSSCKPAIASGVTVARQQGSAGAASTIATVSDAETSAGNLSVTAGALPTGITLTNVVNVGGTISATIAAGCNAAVGNNTVTLTVTDGDGLQATATLTVNVTANTPPVLTYANQSVTVGNGLTVNPATGLSDNGGIASIVAQPAAGTVTVNNANGVLTLGNDFPVGTNLITIRVTDTCGAIINASFTLTVNSVVATSLGNYANATVITGANTSVTPSAPPTNAAGATATTSPNFKGLLAVSPSTGVVNITDAHPAGAYTVTVKSFSSNGGTATKTFTLTVNNPANCSPTSSGFGAAPSSPIGVGSFPFYSAIGDFNGDGKQDLAVTNNTSNNVTILLGDGAGGFNAAAGSPVGTGANPFSVAVSDFNGDGKQDLAVGNQGSNDLTILLGNGGGGFAVAPGSPVGGVSNPQFVAAGDFNGDGKADLAVANNTSNVAILLGNGSGGFSPASASPVSVGDSPRSIAVSDFNADGKQDMAVMNSTSNNVTILLGDGAGGFSAASGSPVSVGNRPYAIVAGNFNGDAQPDLAVANYLSGDVTILLGGLNGTFTQVTGSPVTLGGNPHYLALGDFNSDGQQDLVVSRNDATTLRLLIGNGSGGFTTAATSVNAGNVSYSVVVGDFNGDGRQDLAATNFNANNVAVLLSNCTPSITPIAPLTRQAGTLTAATIAGVSDVETPNNLTVTAVNVPPGLSLTGISSGADGAVTANIVVLCNATPGSNIVGLTVTDADGLTTSTNLTVNVTANTPPTLSYANQSVAAGGALTINPATGLGDNGSVASVVLQSQGTYTGTISVNASGVVSISNAKPGGAHTITIRATDNCGATRDASFTLTVNCPTVTITPATLPSGQLSQAYGQQLTGNGGTGAYTFAITAGALPNGVSLSTAGLLSGTPTATGSFSFTVRATDGNACFGERQYNLTINSGCGAVTINLSPAALANGFVGTAYSQTLTASGGAASYAFAVSAGALPNGLALAANGALTGTPTTAGTFSFTVQATDANGCLGSKAYTVIVSGNGLQFYPLPQPVRLLETRPGETGCTMPGAIINAGGTFTLPARTPCAGIPAEAQAVTGNITVVPTSGGFLTLFPSTAAQPTVANSNFGPNEVTNNVFTVGLGATGPDAGAFKIFASGTTHVIVDVTGYFAPPNTGGLYFHPLATPVRLLETRAGLNGCIAPSSPLIGSGNPNSDPNLDFVIQGRSPVASPCNSIPASAQMLVGNATSVVPDGGGYLTIYPSGGTRPLIASSNYGGGDVINGPFTVKLGADGKFKIYTLRTTHLVVDIIGYYSEEAVDANGAGLLFNPLPVPVRLLETRPGGPPLTGCTRTNAPIQGNLNAATHTQPAAGFCGLPASAQAVVGNASVVSTPAAGYLTLFPGNLTIAPLVATSNYPTPASSGYNRHYFVGLSPVDGTFKVLTSSTTELILDASGYFAP